jgi:hypothetical protein
VVLILLGVWLFLRNRRLEEAVGENGYVEMVIPGGAVSENEETLMDAILALDDLYRAGELGEEAYRQRRAELKARLRELLG